MKRFYIQLILLCFGIQSQAQELSDYKYIVVPDKYDFQNSENQYDLNELSRFLFRKYGFEAFLSKEEMPADLNKNGCNTLYASIDKGGIFTTKVILNLKNCRGQLVYASEKGVSRIKSFQEGYQDAFRKAFAYFEDLGYTYNDGPIAPVNEATEYAADTLPATEDSSATSAITPEKEVVVAAVIEPVDAGKKVVPTAEIYSSEDGSYTLRKSADGFAVMDVSGKKIGSATRTSTGAYLVTTTEFSGVGAFEGERFFIEREIKGVSGLVKMVFIPKN